MAGRIPQQFIDDLVSRVDIVGIIDERVPLKKAGRDYMARCPFHDEKTPSFTVSQEKQFYHCFGCGAHGTAIGFLMDYAHMGFVEAVRDLASRAGMALPTTVGNEGASVDNGPLYEILEEAARDYRRQLREHPGAERAVTYLKGRGLSGQVAADFGLGFAPPEWDHLLKRLGTTAARTKVLAQAGLVVEREDGRRYDRFRDRIVFPILDRRGRTVGFGGRVLGNGTPKYLNSPETPVFHKGREVYGLFQAQAGRPLRLLVVEGYMDVVALAQYGMRNVVATLGTAITAEHLEQLYRATDELVFCFDGDDAGRRAAWRALETSLPHMRDGRQATFMFLPEGEDPDSLVRRHGAEHFTRLVDQTMPLSDFFFEQLTKQVNTTSLDGRARLVELCRPLLNRLPGGAFRQLMAGRLAELAHMDVVDLTTLLEGRREPTRRAGRAPRSHTHAPSLIRKTVTLLLHDPSLARKVDTHHGFGALALPGADVLARMLDLLEAQPHLNMAGLLEHFRDTEMGRHLTRLAMSEDAATHGADPAQEFQGAIRKLRSKLQEPRFEELQHKARAGTLSDAEKREYAELIQRGQGDTQGAG